MAKYSLRRIRQLLDSCNDPNSTNQAKGAAFEALACYIFETVPGVSITETDEMNVFQNEEIDVALWNDRVKFGFNFLPNIVLIECKNWNNPVSSIEVAWFAQKLVSRGLDFGILIANNGITGDTVQLTASHHTIAIHLAQKRNIIVITCDEIKQLRTTDDLISLIKRKLCKLAVSGRIN
jgi:hypothetical protein